LLENHEKVSPGMPLTLALNAILPSIYSLSQSLKSKKGTDFRNSL